MELAESLDAPPSRGRATETDAADHMPGDVHVINRSTGWRLEIDGSGRVHTIFPRHRAAWEAGKALARRKQCTALLHARAGGVRAIYDGRRGCLVSQMVASSTTNSRTAEGMATQ